jgi:isopropylmalate/homocitrate/citramalate synthase
MPLSNTLPAFVRVVEVGPRDGLQNIARTVPTAVKLAFIEALAAAGIANIEATSFVSPRAVPQLADAAEVFAGLPLGTDVVYSALVPNARGMSRAIDAGVRAVAVFTAASESFTRHNINMTIDESFAAFAPVFELARMHAIPVRGYVSTAFYCPYEGKVAPDAVCGVAARLLGLGAFEVSIGDTIGAATPIEVEQTILRLRQTTPVEKIAVHFHDTRGTALANVLAALRLGITVVDAAAGGLGGCPYAPGAAGNLATEDLLYMLHGMGVATGIDLDRVCAATKLLSDAVNLQPTSKMYRAWLAAQVSLFPIIST